MFIRSRPFSAWSSVPTLANIVITSGHELTKGKLTTRGYLAHAQGASTNQNTTTTIITGFHDITHESSMKVAYAGSNITL